jgi:predicted RNase H-like HicB family nuclease
MGQLVEWPEVVTEGADLDECRAMLRDALNEMLLAYRDLGKEIPPGNALFEQLSVLRGQWLPTSPRRRQPFDLHRRNEGDSNKATPPT